MKINGKPVVDAKRKLILTITADDVKKGSKRKPDCCAAAVACIRQENALAARVHASRIYIEYPRKWVRFVTPANLHTEIVSFDRGYRFETGDYSLAPFGPTQKANGTRKGTDTGSDRPRHKKKKRAPYHHLTGIRGRMDSYEKDRA